MAPKNPQFSLMTRLSLLTQRQGFRPFRRVSLACLALVIVFGFSFWFNSSRVAESEDKSLVADTHLDSYERIIEKGNVEEIIAFLRHRNTVSSLELPVRIEHYQNRFQLAERLSEIAREDEHQEIASLSKIESRMSLLNIYQSNDLDTIPEINTIDSLTLSLVDAKSSKVRKKASLAELYSSMEKLRLGQIEEAEIKRSILRIANLDIEDYRLASQITHLLNHHSSLGMQIGNLLTEVTKAYAESSSSEIKDLVNEIRMAFFRRQYHLLPMSKAELEIVKTTIFEHTETVEKALDNIKSTSFVTKSNYNSLLTSLIILSQYAPNQSFAKLINRCKKTLDEATTDGIETSQVDILHYIANSIGNPFPVQSFTDVEGKEHPVVSPGNKITLLYSITSGDKMDPMKRLLNFSIRFAKLVEDGHMGFKVIYIGDEKVETEWGELVKWSNENPSMTLAHIRVRDNLDFFNDFVIPWSPCWMLIDPDLGLAEFNPLYPVLRSRLHLYLE